jgi:hypothetical protein
VICHTWNLRGVVFSVATAGGGNCASVCANGVGSYEPCLAEHSCRADKTSCSADCQECIADVYSECGGCDDWDTTTGPTYKTDAESMGCNGAAQVAPAGFFALTAVIGHFIN